MIGYALTVDGNLTVALRFDRFPAIATNRLEQHMRTTVTELTDSVRASVPKGKTGKLLAQVHSGVEVSDVKVRGWVSLAGDAAQTIMAAALEYGSKGTKFPVAGYTRQIDDAFGKMTEPFDQVIAAYSRVGGMHELNFLRGPFNWLAPEFIAGARAAVDEAIAESENA